MLDLSNGKEENGEATAVVGSKWGKLWPELSLRRCKRGGRGGSASPLELEGTLFKVLTFLPLCKIYELRLVCKSWNALLTSPAFLSAWSATTHKELLVMVRNVPFCPSARLLIAFDSASHQWISLLPLLASCPQPALSVLGGPLLSRVGNPLPGRKLRLSYFMAVSGAPGLVCMLHSPLRPCSANDYDYHVFSFLVMNLFTGSHHLLPTPPRHCDELASWEAGKSVLRISMAPLPHGDYYVFLQPRWHNFPGPLEIYDSCSRSWKVGKPCCGPSDAKIATAADVNRADLVQHLRGTGIVFTYSVELDEWSQVYAKSPLLSRHEDGFYHPQFCRDGCILFRNRGWILLAAVRCAGSYFAGFGVWKLSLRHSVPPASAAPGTPIADWVEVASTPQHLCTLEVEYGKKQVKIISSGNLICMTVIPDAETNNGQRPLVYDLVCNSWYHLPPYKGGYDLTAAFSLQPSFGAIP